MTELQPLSAEEINKYGLISDIGSVNRQNYEPIALPDGVVTVPGRKFVDGQGGYFIEMVRFNDDNEIIALKERNVHLKVKQVNASIVGAGTERFGHVHPDQDEFWTAGLGQLTVALYDLRAESSTRGAKTKLVIADGSGVFIPHGIAHGLANYTTETVGLLYFPSHHFTAGKESQELRFVPEDKNFWDFAKPDKI